MVLKRWEICQIIGFNSWTAVQVWLAEVVTGPFVGLISDYLEPFSIRGERNPPGTTAIKEYFVRFAEDLDRRVERRVSELEHGVLSCPNKHGWDTKRHYEEFIVEAVAMDRLASRQAPQGNYIAARDWSREPVKLFATMYELTETICHNYWKTAESEMWPSDDSDVPYTDEGDVPGA